MKKVLISTIAAALAMSFAASAHANSAPKQKVATSVQASCKQEAAKKFSAIHFLKRRNFANNCMAQHASAKAKPVATSQAAKPMTTGQAAKPTTTGQAPKQ
jgi:hypothetical protein